MQIIPPRFLGSFPLKADFVNFMEERGYVPQQADASGAWILMHPKRQLVWKIGEDRPTVEFARFMAATAWRPELPRVFAVTGQWSAYTIIAMERLLPFPCATQWDAWLFGDFYKNRGAPRTDPFGAAAWLSVLLADASAHGVHLDVQAKNVMMRRRTGQLVFFDPFS